MSKGNPVAIPCGAYLEMAQRWELLHDLLGGTKKMREKAEKWLPREEAESQVSYSARINRSFLYGALNDTRIKLRAKPFSRPVDVKEADALPDMLQLIEDDADNARSSLTAFASALFDDALIHGLTHLMVDFPDTGGAQSLAEERERQIHPYFVHVKAESLIGWQSEMDPSTGREVLTQVRIKTEKTENDGNFGQKEVEYVHVWTRESVTTYRESKGKEDYELVGEKPHSFGSIPLYTVYFNQTGFMTAAPPLEDLAWLNLEHWQSSSEQRNVLHVARVPILYERGAGQQVGANGKAQGGGPVVISTSRMRQTAKSPSEADLSWVEVGGKSIDAGQNDLAKIEERMQMLGMQPLLETTSKTATEAGIGEARAHSAIKSWCWALNDALFEGYYMAAKWIKAKLPEKFAVSVWDKFELEARSDTDMTQLMGMRAAGDISRRRLLIEAKRRGKFGEDFDVEKELAETQDAELPEPSEAEMQALAAMRAKDAPVPAAPQQPTTQTPNVAPAA